MKLLYFLGITTCMCVHMLKKQLPKIFEHPNFPIQSLYFKMATIRLKYISEDAIIPFSKQLPTE